MTELLRLWKLFRPYRPWIWGGYLVAVITLVANVTLLAISGWFITAMAVAGAAGLAMNYFTPAAAIRACAIGRTGGRYLERLISHEATLRQLSGLRVWFYGHLEPLAPARLQQFHSGDLLSRIRADIDALDNFYVRVLIPVLVAITATLGFFVFTAFFDLTLALSLLALLLVGGGVLPYISRQLGRAPGRELVEKEAALRQTTIDGTQGLSELLIFGAADAHARRLDALSAELIAAQDRMSKLSGIAQGGVGLCANLSLWAALWLGIPLLHDGSLAPPQLAMLALLALASFEAVAPLPLAFQQLESTLTAARRLFSIVDTAPAAPEPVRPAALPDRFDLEIQGVSFKYPGADHWALRDLSFELPAGKRIAIVGPTGSGKTSVFNLLLRFWLPDTGKIQLGQVPLGDFQGEQLRHHLALVSQNTYLFNTSIRENLLLAAPNAPESALEHACRVAQIHDVIEALPEGYDTWVGETGVRISGGQARRLAIARALLKDAPILLLDEPTEGLDGPTEQALMHAIDQIMHGRSTLLITHRPAALARMDEILVLDQGQIRERGTHEELLKGGSIYPRLLGFDASEAA